MPPKSNPLNLNMLQLKTLTLLQELARHPEAGAAQEDGGFQISRLPQPHGDHFHIGQVAVRASQLCATVYLPRLPVLPGASEVLAGGIIPTA